MATVSPIQINSFLVDMIMLCLQADSMTQHPGNAKVDTSYLLSQIIRQYCIPSSNLRESVKARQLWNSLTSEPMSCYFYKEYFVADKLTQPMSIQTFKGSNRKSAVTRIIQPNEKVAFNEVFVCEHLIAVSDVIKALRFVYQQNTPYVRQQVIDILDKMCVCKLLRTEDRSIKKSCHRITTNDLVSRSSSWCFSNLYNTYYVPVGIII